jgi:hypothetical protein
MPSLSENQVGNIVETTPELQEVTKQDDVGYKEQKDQKRDRRDKELKEHVKKKDNQIRYIEVKVSTS